MSTYKKLGVIGCVGPAATALFFSRVVEYTNVARDQDHLSIDIVNRPSIPDRTDFLLGKPGAPSFVPAMNELALQLEAQGCELLATPCNTAHAQLDAIASGLTNAHFVNMLDATAQFVASLGAQCCGVLATSGTIETKVYDYALQEHGIACVAPCEHDQAFVMKLIYEQVKAGRTPDAALLERICNTLFEDGCDVVILGCTELSVIPYERVMNNGFVVDALDVLAWRCVEECGAPARDLHDLFMKDER